MEWMKCEYDGLDSHTAVHGVSGDLFYSSMNKKSPKRFLGNISRLSLTSRLQSKCFGAKQSKLDSIFHVLQ